MNKVKVLQEFFSTVFTENCRCFQVSCDIETETKPVKTLLNIFREIQNKKSCSTFFDRKRLDFGGTLHRHLTFMLNLGLVSKRDKTYVLANGQELSWVALQGPHPPTGPCYCDPLQNTRNDLDRLMEHVRGPHCKILMQCPHLSKEHIHELVRCIFWFFRKAVVDNLIHYSFVIDTPRVATLFSEPKSPGTCHAVSVGSMRISSDYDVTMYGNCVSNVIGNFNRAFGEIFGRSAATVFDTNIYGSSFLETAHITEFDAPARPFYDWVDCSSTEYDEEHYLYVKSAERLAVELSEGKVASDQVGDLVEAVTQQHIWATLKLKRALNRLVEETRARKPRNVRMASLFVQMHGVLHRVTPVSALNGQLSRMSIPTPMMLSNVDEEQREETVFRPVSFEIARQAEQFLNNLIALGDVDAPSPDSPKRSASMDSHFMTKDVDYGDLPFELIRSSTKYGDLLNVISTFNFFGDETYFTRGAFMHVVFGQQTCKTRFADLTAHDYLDSFIENLADCIHHDFKVKYVVRMYSALSVIQGYSGATFANLLGFLTELQEKATFSDAEKYELSERSFHFVLMAMTDWTEGVSLTDQVALILHRARRVVTYLRKGGVRPGSGLMPNV